MYLFLLLSLFFNAAPTAPAKNIDNIEVCIKNIRFEKGGYLYLELLDARNQRVQKIHQQVKAGENTFVFSDLPFGKYAVRAFHDANNNGKIDIGMFGPTEGWGVSNDARGFMSAPPFNKMLFDHSAQTKISLKFSY